MAENPNTFTKFWNELKRRKVIKVLAMYCATAFIIMEAAEIMLPRLGLPDWTVTLIVVLLIAGLPITIIISWIFDITPEGIKKTEAAEEEIEEEKPASKVKRGFRLSDAIIAVLFILVCVLLFPKIFPSDRFEEIRDEDGRISIAVMPFENQTGDTALNWFEMGISSLITNGLGGSNELAVRDDHTMHEVIETMGQVNTAGFNSSQARGLAQKVQAEAYVSGSYHGRNGKYWILANLVNSESGDILLTTKIEGDLNSAEYLDLANELCNEIKDYLEIKVLEQETAYDFRDAYTKSAEAYRFYIEGMNYLLSRDYQLAIKSLEQAFEIDSTFTFASFYIAYANCYVYPQQGDQMLIWTQKAYELRDKLPMEFQLWVELWEAIFFRKDLQKIIQICSSLEEAGIESRLFWFDLAMTYRSVLNQYDKAILALQKIEEISAERGGPWNYEEYYWRYASLLLQTGDIGKLNEISELALELFPNNINRRDIYWCQAAGAFSQGDSAAGEAYLAKYIAVKKEIGQTADNIEFQLGNIYSSGGVLDQAELHYRKAIELNPQKIGYRFNLGTLLIDKDINMEEGLEIIEDLLTIHPDAPGILAAKSRAYYKLGRYEEALELVNQADEIFEGFSMFLIEQKQEIELAMAAQ